MDAATLDDFRAGVRRFVEREVAPHVDAWDEAGEFPRELYRRAAALGLLGLGYPEALGGTPCDFATRLVAVEEIARAGSGGLLASLFSHNIALPPILAAGSAGLQRRVIAPVLAGEEIAALAVTEPGGGSDVAQLRTTARRDGDAYVIDGEKVFITSGMRADWLTVAVRTGGPGAGGISLLAVPGDAPGLTRTPLKKMGWWCSDTAHLRFDGVRVPADHLIGAEHGGFRLIMENFNGERLVLAAGAVAFAQVAYDEALDWARQRRTFGRTLVEHQAVRHKLMDMRTRIVASRALLADVTRRLDAAGSRPDAETVADLCLLKNDATRTMQHCADAAVQILGGMGYMRGTKSERIYREVKVMTIGGGTDEIMKELAARQLGV
ncbi:acyl-CoA dehydrogenase family protein [Calidifontimicrobium sp. SYSU G02091]|uniref:acyl-CoA dehydrogenase family protein n=1 Tax=Calidifontimicrobium sp. SYSU G02091 TaxID=2926421 RepID=UPI001F5330BE|nr:acyl-CoA dehydrogenase family protein [Calidifontimicrobium sp. SYSU G02091]